MYQQFALQHGSMEVVCWLPVLGRRLRAGMAVTLKGDSRRWAITTAYQATVETPPDTRWGLSLPKSARTER